jgi:polyferredoxin
VCPTGIDIRQGLQMECIGCAACIDACDEVMDKVKSPRGLIRYDSQVGLNGRKTRILRPRLFVYLALLLAGAVAFTLALSRVQPSVVTAFRMQGLPYFVDRENVRNQFLLHVINKTDTTQEYTVVAEAPGQTLAVAIGAVRVEPQREVNTPVVLSVPRSAWTGPFTVNLVVSSADGGTRVERKLEFIGPDARLLREATPSGP